MSFQYHLKASRTRVNKKNIEALKTMDKAMCFLPRDSFHEDKVCLATNYIFAGDKVNMNIRLNQIYSVWLYQYRILTAH